MFYLYHIRSLLGISVRKFIFCVFILQTVHVLYPIYLYASEVDSLNKFLPDSASDTERLLLLDRFVEKYIGTDLDKALVYAEYAVKLSSTVGSEEQKIKALHNMGLVLYKTEDRKSSLDYFVASERLAESGNFPIMQANNLMSIAKYHRYTTYDSTKTVNNFLKSAKVSKSSNYHWGAGRSYAKLASFYTRYNRIDLCESYMKRSIPHYLRLDDGHLAIAHYYSEVGDKIWNKNPMKSMDFYLKGIEYSEFPFLQVSLAKAYSYLEDYDTALTYLNKAIPYFRVRENRKRILGIALAQIAQVYIQQGNYTAAEKACDEGIELLCLLERSDQHAIPSLLRSKGFIFEQSGDHKSALDYYTDSLNEAKRIKVPKEAIWSKVNIGNIYTYKDSDKAKIYCEEALVASKDIHHPTLEIKACECLYNIYKSKNKSALALQYYVQKTELNYSLIDSKVKHTLGINSQIAQKDKQLAEQVFQKEIRDKDFRNQNILITSLIICSIFALMFIGIQTFSNRKIVKQNKEIKEKTNALMKTNLSLKRSNTELERFAHIASHDLKSPLRNIMSYTGLLKHKLNGNDVSNVSFAIDFIEKSGNRMYRLINDILQYSKLSSTSSIQKEYVDLNELLHEVENLTQNLHESKHITFKVSELPHINWFHSKIFLLFKNIIENGIKYNQSENPIIRIHYTHNSSMSSVYIEDNGIGIESEYFDEIFTMFNRLHAHSEYEGSGLGLSTCSKIVEEFNGQISVTSEINCGTIFRIDFPSDLVKFHPYRIEIDSTEHYEFKAIVC